MGGVRGRATVHLITLRRGGERKAAESGAEAGRRTLLAPVHGPTRAPSDDGNDSKEEGAHPGARRRRELFAAFRYLRVFA